MICKNLKAVIFDMDGTVLDTLEDLTDALNHALLKCNLPIHTIDEVRTYVGSGIVVMMQRAVPADTPKEIMDSLFAYFKEYYKDHCNDKTHAYEGIPQLMAYLKEKGIKLAIVSNKIDSAVKELNDIYFDGLVDEAIGEKKGVNKKPAPDMVFEAMKKLGVTQEEAVYVGDSDVDYATAQNSGLPCISVLWGFKTKDFLESLGATCFAEAPRDIINILGL